jgi:hypothetical protein
VEEHGAAEEGGDVRLEDRVQGLGGLRRWRRVVDDDMNKMLHMVVVGPVLSGVFRGVVYGEKQSQKLLFIKRNAEKGYIMLKSPVSFWISYNNKTPETTPAASSVAVSMLALLFFSVHL